MSTRMSPLLRGLSALSFVALLIGVTVSFWSRGVEAKPPPAPNAAPVAQVDAGSDAGSTVAAVIPPAQYFAGSKSFGGGSLTPPPPPPPGVGTITVEGQLDLEVIRTVVRRHHFELRECHQKFRSGRIDEPTKLNVKLVLVGTGVVHTADPQEPKLSPELHKCLVRKMKHWIFPESRDGLPVTVLASIALDVVEDLGR